MQSITLSRETSWGPYPIYIFQILFLLMLNKLLSILLVEPSHQQTLWISLNPTLRSALVATSATRLVIQETIGFLLMVTCRVPYLVSSSYSHCAHDNRHIACRLLRTVHTQIISTTSLSKVSHSSKQIFQLIPFLLGYWYWSDAPYGLFVIFIHDFPGSYFSQFC